MLINDDDNYEDQWIYSLVGFGDERSIDDEFPFHPSRGPAVERNPPRRKSSPVVNGLEGSPSRAPELFRFNLQQHIFFR